MNASIAGRRFLGQPGRRPPWMVVVALLGLIGAGLLLALLLGLGAITPVAIVLGLAAAGFLVVLGLAEPSQKALAWLLGTVLAVTLLHPLVEGSLRLPIGYLFELLCFTLLIGAGVSAYRHHGESPWLRALALLALGYFVLALASTALGRSERLAALWQFQYNLKLPAMFLIGMLLAFDTRQQAVLRAFVRLAWLPLAAFVALEILAPSTWTAITRQPLDHTLNPLIGWGVRRAGLFQHSGLLALTVAMLGWICLVLAWQRRSPGWALNALPYLVLVLLSGQRQEALALLMGGLVLLGFALRRHWRVLLVAGGLLTGLLVVVALLLNLGLVQKLSDTVGAGQGLEPVSERTVLTRTGVAIASEWAPLGSGLGTYGGAGAQKFDQSQFEEYGFGKLWWFRRGMFLIDVYWPSVAAESGFVAAGLWMAALLLILALVARQAWRDGDRQPLAWFGTGALVLMLGNSPTSAALTDPRVCFWMWLLAGAAAAHALRQLQGKETRAALIARRMSELGAGAGGGKGN